MKCNEFRPGFELLSPSSFPTTITITPRAPPGNVITDRAPFTVSRLGQTKNWHTCPDPHLGSWNCLPHQAHIALSEPMSSTDKLGSSLGSFPTSPPLYPHFHRPSGFWPGVKSCLVGGSDKYWAPAGNLITDSIHGFSPRPDQHRRETVFVLKLFKLWHICSISDIQYPLIINIANYIYIYISPIHWSGG